MADVIRNAVIKLAVEQGDTVLKPPDISKIKRAQDELIAKERELEQQRQQSAAAAGNLAAKQLDDLQKMLGAVEQVGDGMFLMARAGALLGADTDEDLKKILNTLMKIQGAWDLFKGASAMTRGLAESLKITRDAQIALGVATQATTLATVAQTAAILKLRAALTLISKHPIIVALTVITTLVYAAIKAYEYFTDSTEKDAAAQDKLTARLEKQQRVRTAATKARIDDINRAKSAGVSLGDLEGQQKSAASLQMNTVRGLERQQQVLQVIAAQRAKIISGMEKQATVQAKIKTEALSELKARRQAILVQQRALETAKDALKTEKEKVMSLEAQFGALNRIEQDEANRLAKKLKEGSATLQEAKKAASKYGQFLGPQANEQLAVSGRGAMQFDIRSGVREKGATVDREDAERRRLTGGASTDFALAAIDSAENTVKEKFQSFLDQNTVILEKAIEQQNSLAHRIGQIDVDMAKAR